MLNVKRNPFETDVVVKKTLVEHRFRKMLVFKDVLHNGTLVRKTEIDIVDMSVPRTPQTGLDTHIGDIAYYVRNNMQVEHNEQYLTNLGTNPFALESLKRSLDSNFKPYSDKYSDFIAKYSKNESED